MADVTVRGAGIFGLSIAWACARRGARVRVIDPAGPGSGASGGLVGALAPHVPEAWNDKKAFQFESLLMAENFWKDVEITGGVSAGYARLGRLQPVPDQPALDLAHRRAAEAERLWQGKASWQVRPASDFPGWCPRGTTGFVILDTLSARIQPRRACAALVSALMVIGAEIVADGPDSGQVLWATGTAGLNELSAGFGRIVGSGVKGQAALMRFGAGAVPQIFADGVHIVPHGDGTLAVGSTTEREFEYPDTTDGGLDDVIDRAVRALPLLHGAPIVERWAGLRPRSRSRAPMLGPHPLYPGQFIANGGFKIGFGMAPMVARVMADLMLDGADAIPPGFRPEASL